MVNLPWNDVIKGDLRTRRLALGLTQAELADRFGVRANTLARWERGELSPRRPERILLVLEDLESAAHAWSDDANGRVRTGHSMPGPLNSFVGRQRQAAQVLQLLREHRLVTIVGTGGVGKTRLALHVAEQVAKDAARSVLYASVASISDPDLVVPTIAQAAGIPDTRARLPRVLANVLNREPLLLVVDNFEHVAQAGAELVDLLRGGQQLHVLVTSRSPLRVAEEQLFPLRPLELPEGDETRTGGELAEAVRLFVDRARAVRPDLELTAETVGLVGEICRRVDGLPLAIELAAASLRTLSIAAIRAGMSTSLDVLVDGPRNQPTRHQSMHAAIDWSYCLLRPEEQQVFRRLAVFVSDFSLAAATAVCAGTSRLPAPQRERQVLATLRALVDNALVQVVDTTPNEPRFALLNVVREYAAGRLAARPTEAREAERKHMRYYLSLSEKLGDAERVWEAADAENIDRLQREQDQVRHALRTALDRRDFNVAARFGRALWQMWHMRGHYAEGRRWLDEILRISTPSPASGSRFDLLEGSAYLAYREADYSVVCSLVDDMLRLTGDEQDEVRVARAHALGGLANYSLGRLDQARQSFERALEMFRNNGCAARSALCLHHLALVAYHSEQYFQARALAEESAEIARRLGSAYVGAMAMRLVGFAAEGLREYGTATSSLEEACRLAALVQLRWVLLESQEALGRVASAQGDYADARRSLLEALREHRKLGQAWGTARCLEGIGSIEVQAGDARIGLRLLGAAIGVRQSLGSTASPRQQRLAESLIDAAGRRGVDEQASSHLVSEGVCLSMEQAVALAERQHSQERQTNARQQHATLTARERDVLRLVGEGRTTSEIATLLVLSVRTVDRHIFNAYEKLGVHNRAQAAAFAVRYLI